MVPNYKLAMFAAVKTVQNCIFILSMKYKLPIWKSSLVPHKPPTFLLLSLNATNSSISINNDLRGSWKCSL